jgi:hypothetical protein
MAVKPTVAEAVALLNSCLGEPYVPRGATVLLIQATPDYADALREGGVLDGTAPNETYIGISFAENEYTAGGVAAFHDGGGV